MEVLLTVGRLILLGAAGYIAWSWVKPRCAHDPCPQLVGGYRCRRCGLAGRGLSDYGLAEDENDDYILKFRHSALPPA